MKIPYLRGISFLSGAAMLLGLTACLTPQPRIAPPAGMYTCPQTVTLSDSRTDAAIFYTTDGSAPTTASAKYSNPFPLTVDGRVQAIAQAPSAKASKPASAVYTCSNAVTSASFAVQIQQHFNLPQPASPIQFVDLKPSDSAYAAAQAIGPYLNRQVLCHGCQISRNFVPGAPLQRAESAVVFVSLLTAQKKLQLVTAKDADAILAAVTDASFLQGVPARRYVASAIRNGLLPLHEGSRLDGDSPISPEEMASVLQIIQKNFNLPPAELR